MRHLILIFVWLMIMFPAHGIAAEQKVEIEITGMTCSLCTIAIKKSLSEIDGIKDVKVSYRNEKAWFATNDFITDEILTEAVEKAGGYKVRSIRRD